MHLHFRVPDVCLNISLCAHISHIVGNNKMNQYTIDTNSIQFDSISIEFVAFHFFFLFHCADIQGLISAKKTKNCQ